MKNAGKERLVFCKSISRCFLRKLVFTKPVFGTLDRSDAARLEEGVIELRLYEPGVYWPYCILCRRWATEGHCSSEPHATKRGDHLNSVQVPTPTTVPPPPPHLPPGLAQTSTGLVQVHTPTTVPPPPPGLAQTSTDSITEWQELIRDIVARVQSLETTVQRLSAALEQSISSRTPSEVSEGSWLPMGK